MQAIGLSLCPESPVWLEWKRQPQAASKARLHLHGTEAVATDTAADGAAALEGGGEDATQPLRQGSDSVRYTEDQVGHCSRRCNLLYRLQGAAARAPQTSFDVMLGTKSLQQLAHTGAAGLAAHQAMLEPLLQG